jgi:transcriptional regulator with XRE-family HTH domain
MKLKQIFIANLKEFRKRKRFSQMKLAEKCDTAASYIGEIEIGRKFPSTEMIEKIAKALNIEPQWLFWDTEHKELKTELELTENVKNGILRDLYSAINSVLDRY